MNLWIITQVLCFGLKGGCVASIVDNTLYADKKACELNIKHTKHGCSIVNDILKKEKYE